MPNNIIQLCAQSILLHSRMQSHILILSFDWTIWLFLVCMFILALIVKSLGKFNLSYIHMIYKLSVEPEIFTKKVFVNLPPAIISENFSTQIFLSCVDDYIEHNILLWNKITICHVAN